ncbi:hypothetical protein DH2020_048614 [Rehmannia glutinosa]|uniref:beta-carotene 3-hydroxylase n=1 Tax=Rehmannia glutinosa TaxID=99300 RepID=A0ABR0U560_REHGL
MAVGISVATTSRTVVHFKHSPFLGPKPTSLAAPNFRVSRFPQKCHGILRIKRRKPNLTVCFVLEDEKLRYSGSREVEEESGEESTGKEIAAAVVAEKVARKKSERFTYLVAAVMSSFGITSMAVMAVYYRFAWQMEAWLVYDPMLIDEFVAQGGEVPYTEMFGTFALSVGAAVGMEFWARWAHKALWHASLWHMHESHHKPREGPFELNDVFAIINAVPAIALLSYGFFHKGIVPGLCFGAGLGITVFGMAYMFVHDGLVHRRFPVGPIANVPYFRRVASAHQELEEVGGLEELEKEINRRIKLSKNL